MAAKKKTKKKTSTKKTSKKVTATRKTATKKLAAKRKPLKKKSVKKAASKKPALKKKVAAKKAAPKAKKRPSQKGPNSSSFPATDLRTRSGLESGDRQGLSRRESADSESVDELIEEGNSFEAGVVTGVEEADDADESEVHTHEVPEDDVPGEYLDED
jgi:hypothetical protein